MYNVGGNIVSKTEYAYTTGTVGNAIKTYNYTYGNAWKDQLTAFDGTAITYDASGNPTSYLGKTLTWSRGRLLTKNVSGSKTVEMQYDGKGMRIGKSRKIGSTTTNSTYIYDNSGKLHTEVEGSTTRNYIYGADGVVGYEENNEQFMYRKNFFGDIIAIYKGATKIAEYSYDAWGNCTIPHDSNGYGSRNPFRYRGYYFDTDLNMYYLTTRYYDPHTGRFINADNLNYLEPQTINGLNLYAYCGNNPIMCIDPTGTRYAQTSVDGEYDLDDDMYYGGGGGGGYCGPGSAYHTYTVRTNTATHDAQLGGYHTSGNTAATLNPNYFIVAGAVTVNDSMVTAPASTNTKYITPEDGGGITDTWMVNNIKVTFGHGGRHLSSDSLSVNDVNKTIAYDVVSREPAYVHVKFATVCVGGYDIEYRYFTCSPYWINIGTYYIQGGN